MNCTRTSYLSSRAARLEGATMLSGFTGRVWLPCAGLGSLEENESIMLNRQLRQEKYHPEGWFT